MTEKICKKCKYRKPSGYCDNDNITDDDDWDTLEPDRSHMLIYSYPEGGEFWVGEMFGCVHFKEKDGE